MVKGDWRFQQVDWKVQLKKPYLAGGLYQPSYLSFDSKVIKVMKGYTSQE